MNNIDLTPILQALIGLLATLITAKLIPWIKTKIAADKQGLFDAAVQSLVFAAEQLYGAGKGAEKLKYVKDELAKKGFAIDDAAIEAKVYELLNKIKAPSTVINTGGEIRADEGVKAV